MWAIGEPSGPIENGTTYIVRPAHRAVEERRRGSSRISAGSRQLLVGPASSSCSEQMKVRSSTRATSRDPSARGRCWGAGVGERSKVPASTSSLAEPVVLLGGAVAPVDRVGLGQLGDLLDPGDQLGVLGRCLGSNALSHGSGQLLDGCGPWRGLRCGPLAPGRVGDVFTASLSAARHRGPPGRDRHLDASRGGRRCRRRPALITLVVSTGSSRARPAIRCDKEIVARPEERPYDRRDRAAPSLRRPAPRGRGLRRRQGRQPRRDDRRRASGSRRIRRRRPRLRGLLRRRRPARPHRGALAASTWTTRRRSSGGRRVREMVEAEPVPELARPRRSTPPTTSSRGGEGTPAVAVRSSATAEDTEAASFAGMNETFLNIRGARRGRRGGAPLLGLAVRRPHHLLPRQARLRPGRHGHRGRRPAPDPLDPRRA